MKDFSKPEETHGNTDDSIFATIREHKREAAIEVINNVTDSLIEQQLNAQHKLLKAKLQEQFEKSKHIYTPNVAKEIQQKLQNPFTAYRCECCDCKHMVVSTDHLFVTTSAPQPRNTSYSDSTERIIRLECSSCGHTVQGSFSHIKVEEVE